jgi:hypothetical protein
VGQSSQESSEAAKDANPETEKKGLFGKWKAKMSQTKEERQAEKERAKSPPPRNEHGASRSSLTAFAQEHFAPRGRSFDRPREDPSTSSAGPKPATEAQSQGRKSSMDPARGDKAGI